MIFKSIVGLAAVNFLLLLAYYLRDRKRQKMLDACVHEIIEARVMPDESIDSRCFACHAAFVSRAQEDSREEVERLEAMFRMKAGVE